MKKKSNTLNEVLQMYLNSEDDKALFASRLRSKRKIKKPTSYSSNTIVRIKNYLSTKNFQEYQELEDKMLQHTGVNNIQVVTPQKDDICIHHLEFQLNNVDSDLKSVKLSLYDDSGEDVRIHQIEWNNSIDISLKGLRTGRYYWTLTNEAIQKTGRIYYCSPIDAAIIRDSNF